MIRRLQPVLAVALSLTLAFGQNPAAPPPAGAQQPQPAAPVAPGQTPQPTTRQGVEAPPPAIAGQQPGQGVATGGQVVGGLPGPRTPFTPAQVNTALAPVPADRSAILRPYFAVDVPPVRLRNSDRLQALMRAGTLYLTAQDAIALALENSIDLEIARYNPITANWRVTRAQAGGALPGVPSAAAQAGQVAAGQGVTGSQAAAGVRNPGSGGGGAGGGNATISQIGPVTQNLDPVIQESSTFSHTSNPQANATQAAINNLVSNTRAHSGNFQQGLLSGGLINVRYNQNWLRENSPTNILNPSTAANLQVSAQHNLLRGFGIAVNARQITIAKLNAQTSEITFRQQVINVVANVLNAYYQLSASYEDVRARRTTMEVADTFLKNVRSQIDAGALAPPDAIQAESQLVTNRRLLVEAETTLQQRELRLKTLISRIGTSDPVLMAARIVPVDRITIPATENLPPVEQLVREAVAVRTDLAIQAANQQTSEISGLGTRNGLLPNLVAIAAAQNSGLGGTAVLRERPGQAPAGPDPYFVGGPDTALGQIFRRNFPTQRAGAFFGATLRNRQAQSDYALDQLGLRQTELNIRKAQNQVQVDVMNYIVAIQQARARYDAAVKNRELQQALFESEQKRFALGASVPYNVILQQRDLVTAQSAEVSALVTYASARIGLDQTLGRTLQTNGISVAEARDGRVARVSTAVEPPPGTPAP